MEEEAIANTCLGLAGQWLCETLERFGFRNSNMYNFGWRCYGYKIQIFPR